MVKIANPKIKPRRVFSNPYANIDWEKAGTLFQKTLSLNKYNQDSLTKNVLHALAVAGTLGLIFVFPGAAPALGSLVLGRKSISRWRTRQITSRLEKQKYAISENLSDGRVKVTITKNGLRRALTYQLETMQLIKPKKWDSKWRVVIFDIPEKYKKVRDLFRIRLVQMGMYQLQESVYISPYPCFDEIEFLRELYGVPFKVRYLLVSSLEDDDDYLKQHFYLV